MGGRDQFDWNPKAHQPHNPLSKWQRNLRSIRDLPRHLHLTARVLALAPALLGRYRLLRDTKPAPRPIGDPFGVAIELPEGNDESLLAALRELDITSSIIRIAPWEPRLQATAELLRALESSGVELSVACLQDRRSVVDSSFWSDHLQAVFEALPGPLRRFEIGHAWNRRKWGVWHLGEYLRLVETAAEVADSHPGVSLMGPAVIDFEYHFTIGALRHPLCRRVFDTVTALLYVDRRGAPETPQMGFALSQKLRLLRALTDITMPAGTPCWITEFNWPISVPGEYSPVALDKGFDPEECANYLVRYFLLAIATGACERLFWWQLAAHGYGLVDNLDGRWQRRPAFHAFRHLVQRLRGGTFLKLELTRDLYAFHYTDRDGLRWAAAWSVSGVHTAPWRQEIVVAFNRDGRHIDDPAGTQLNGAPCYFQLT
ncbi:hypothetical protein JW905_00765 [bacterium]|nr:hypothetical protein [candidate division CSSED10-310 bacterium]